MRNITVLIEGDHKDLYLSENIVVDPGPKAIMKCVSATIFWDYNNVITGVNDTFTHNGNLITVPEGYWTPNLLTRIRTKCIVKVGSSVSQYYDVIQNMFIEKGGSGFSVYASGSAYNINLGKFGTLIGFDKDTMVLASRRVLAQNPSDLNRGLKYVTVSCDIVDETMNVDTNGKRSSVITTLPVPKGENDLKRTVTQYDDNHNIIPIKAGSYSRLIFDVSTNIGDVGIGSILLELAIHDK